MNFLTYKTLKALKALKALTPLIALTALTTLPSCSDEKFDYKADSSSHEMNLEEYMIVPLKINYEASTATRATSDDEFENGTSKDHRIDFENTHESFALFFDENEKFMFVKPLQTYSSLGSGAVPDDNIGEWEVYALSYVHQDSIPSKVLVVLNGGRIYEKLIKTTKNTEAYIKALANQETDKDTGKKKELTTQPEAVANDFLEFKWESKFSSDGVIGINDRGLYTMSNSAYYGPKEGLTGTVAQKDYELKTVTTLNKEKIIPAMAKDMVQENSAATVYVERLVAKFSPPAFSTQVIGSEHYFRPSSNAMTMVIYGWNSTNASIQEKRNWRVHVLGWTINGRETSNYLYKHIKQAWGEKEDGSFEPGTGPLTNWSRDNWNEYPRRRSYWSIDPHYDSPQDKYFWQFRTTVNNEGKSLQSHEFIPETDQYKDAALRYFDFNYLSQNWSENDLVISENTFSPDTYVYDPDTYVSKSHENWDDRAPLLIGPHLLVGAEVFIEDPNAAASEYNYLGQFISVDHLYKDRLGRFYLSEIDWFKMFLNDMNHALQSQDHMNFPFYEWVTDQDKPDPNKIYTAMPTGHCSLFYDPTVNGTVGNNDPRRNYMNKPLTADLLDQMLSDIDMKNYFSYSVNTSEITTVEQMKKYVLLSIDANVTGGDGRRIPWLEGIVLRNKEQPTVILPVQDENGTTLGSWNNDMRKSLFFEWFGAIDHYYKGYMYYSHPIPHHKAGTNFTYYGAVRNHWYKFTVNSINALGIPVDNPQQKIIPGKYNSESMIQCDIEVIDWHSMQSEITFER